MEEPDTSPEDFEGIDFGTRECLACHEEVNAPGFGRHVFSHDPQELINTWPGGMPGVLDALTDSLTQSIEAAEGHPDTQERLEESLGTIQMLKMALKKRPKG